MNTVATEGAVYTPALSGAVLTLVAIAVMLAAWLVSTVLSDLLSKELRTRLERFPGALLSLAIRRLPIEARAESAEEWAAELSKIVQQTEGLPVTRLARGTRFAIGLLRHSRRIGRVLAPQSRSNSTTRRTAIGLCWIIGGIGMLGPGLLIVAGAPRSAVIGGISVVACVGTAGMHIWTRRPQDHNRASDENHS